MNYFMGIVFLLLESLLAFGFIFILFSLRKKFGYIPFYTYINFLVLMTRVIDNFGLTIVIGELRFLIGPSILFTAILLGLFIVYVFDGPEEGRMMAATVVLSTFAITVVHYLIQAHTYFLGQSPVILLENLNLKYYAMSIVALLGTLILLGIAWEFSLRFQKRVPLILRIFCVLLITMWFDVLLFIPVVFWETPALIQIIQGNLLSRFILSLLALPLLWLFFHWEQKDKDYYFEERPVFAIVQGSLIQQELKLTRMRADRSEEALRESETRFDLAFSKVPTPLMLIAEDGEILLVNDMLEEISGYLMRDIPDLATWTQFAYGEDAPEIEQSIRKNFDITSTVYEGEYVIRTKSGEERIWDFTSTPIGSLSDRRKIVMSMAVDVTARKKVESEFIEQERRYREMIENVGIIAVILDSEGNIAYANDFLLALTGWQREEVTGKSWFKVFLPSAVLADVQQNFDHILRSGEITPYYENPITMKSGEERMIRWSNTTLKDYHGKVIGTASIGEDVTEQKEITEKANRLNEELEKRVQLRTKELNRTVADLESFAYSISHDLRTPLRAIKGYTDILIEDYTQFLDEEGKRYLSFVADSSQRMDELIKGLLSFSRLGRAGITLETLSFNEIVVGVNHDLIDAKDGKTQVKVDDLGFHRADKNLIYQVYSNLIENALKFSAHLDAPEIHVGATRRHGQTIFFVKDNGIGFDMNYADRIFGVFQRLHSAEAYSGSGIGLSIVQRIIHRHGGEIWVESVTDQGTAFYFTLAEED